VPRGPKTDPLAGVRDVRFMGVVSRNQPGNVDKQRPGGMFPCQLVNSHLILLNEWNIRPLEEFPP
jgi:hypothetical protein